MKNLIENTISWNKIGRHAKQEYVFSLGRAKLSKDGSVLTLDIELNFVLPYEDVLRIKALIINQIPHLKTVDLNFIYLDLILSKEEIIKLYIEHMIFLVNGEFASITKTILPDKYSFNGEDLTIFALGNIAVEQLNWKVSKKFERLLRENFNIITTINFDNHGDSYDQISKNQDKSSAKEMEQLHREQKSVDQSTKRPTSKAETNWSGRKTVKEEAAIGNRIMGKPINDNLVSLAGLNTDSGLVAFEGILFRKEARTIKNDKKLVTILITDKKTSVCVKGFTSIKKWEEIDELLNSGDWVKIRGNAEWDTYENQLVVMMKDIEKFEKTSKEDSCEVKRVELHAHTKMSAMDGLNEISEMIITAAKWGHKAIAITDHGVVQAFPEAPKVVKKNKLDIKIIYGLEGYLFDDKTHIDKNGKIDYKAAGTNHVIILTKTQQGLKNLYKLVSTSHLDYFYKKPRIPKSVLFAYREGLLIGSACEAGEIYQYIVNGKEQEIGDIIDLYDYLEIQPLINNQFLIENGTVKDQEELKEINRKIVALGVKYDKPVVATCDSHYTTPEEALYRKILMAGQGYKDIEGDQGLYLRTTDEMLEEFSYLGKNLAYQVVVENTNIISESIENVRPIATGKFPPKIDNAEEILRNKCMNKAWEMYGNPLPEDVHARLDRELNSIINNGYAVMYVSAEMLVRKSLEDGYLVGSRGSVGSSFAATMDGITEVNPLAPHYICEKCRYFEWGDNNEYDCGVDMPVKECPNCGVLMKQDGFDIPFEVFLGFEGDKEPDIDLNFAGEYQSVAHKYVEEIFGKENVFRAGTIGTIANKTAYGFVMKYFEDRQQTVNKWEIERLTECCSGVRRTTGQHPGGIIIVPRGHEIYEFCPIQHPANDMGTETITTHFDYHSIDENLLKLDILGHDVPSMIRQLQDMTGINPLKVPLYDEKVKGLFLGINTLDIRDENYKYRHGSFGIPEFGTKFVRQMLDDTKPNRFGDLVRISGFSHGTDVWLNNAQEYIRTGVATMKDVISTRDDIMNYLIHKGLPNSNAFKIMENVRKGKGLSESDTEIMKDNNVPDWYIDSCNKIKYMFPRAHAVAYVMMAYRIAYYKVYYPREFYATYFTTKVSDFDSEVIFKGPKAILEKIESIENKGKNATKKEEDAVTVLEIAYEMYARGYEFTEARLGESDAFKFKILNEKVLLPLMALSGVGENVAKLIAEEHLKKPFDSIEEIKKRAKANKTAIESLKQHGVLAGIPETDQLSLF
jgi:DNA polymerase-3 subunit alpha (Gram-positive type)